MFMYVHIATGQWHFPCGGHVVSDDAESGDKERLLTTEPHEEMPVHSSSRVQRCAHHPELTTLHESCSSESEDEHSDEDSPRTVEVEVHVEAAVTQELVRQRRFESEFPVCNEAKQSEAKQTDVTDCDQEQMSAQRLKLPREPSMHSPSGVDEPDVKMEHPLMKSRSAEKKTLTKQVSITEAPPTVIPVQVPYCPSPLPTKRPKLSLPLRQISSSSSRKYFPQISQGSATPSTVLTLEARRGFKLKLKIPTEEKTTAV